VHDITLLTENVQNQEDKIKELMYGRSRVGPGPETHGWADC
jgi:hypothetical protein